MIESLITSVLAGGASGLLGMGLQRLFDWLNTKAQLKRDELKFKHELDMRDKDAAIMEKEWQGRLRVADREGTAAENVAADQAFATSLLREPERYSDAGSVSKNQNWLLVLLDVFRGMIRPALTVYLCILVTYIWWQVRFEMEAAQLDAAKTVVVWQKVVDTILYLWVTVTLWWFGTRNKQQPPSVVKVS